MKILFTGASSFTGYWFVTKLAEAGHDVVATFTRSSIDAYGDDVRGRRVRRLSDRCRPEFLCRFGDSRFLDVAEQEKFDLVCHHAADVTNYKSPDFDVCAAVANNTHGIREVLKVLAAKSTGVLFTGSIFGGREGAGSDDLRPFSPYGLSKSITADLFAYYCQTLNVRLGKFVIPNPFGPWEDPRFTAYLMRTWSTGDVASVRTPAYVRDNIHVSLLAAAYVEFANTVVNSSSDFSQRNPSGYVERQGDFAERVAREMRPRTKWECRLDCARQTEFEEPRDRHNTQPMEAKAFGWKESAAWDEFAQWYMS
jgi:nucleoside-diphosphate-sugar epimerase